MTTEAITPLRQRMIEDKNARKLCAGTQRGHIRAGKRFAAFLKRSPETATCEDIRSFQLHLAETAVSICTRNCIMTLDSRGVTFRYKDYRADRHARYKVMTLPTHEFIRRFLIHVLPDGFHRIRHYGLFASASRVDNIARARQLLNAPAPQTQANDAEVAEPDKPATLALPCPCCGGRMIIIETFARGSTPRHRPTSRMTVIRCDTS